MKEESILPAADHHIMDEFIIREGANNYVEEDELEKHIDPVSGYPYYVNLRTGYTFWAHEDDYTEYAEFTHAKDLNDNPVEIQIQLDEEHKEWGIDSTTCNNSEEIRWELDETEEYIGFGGGDGKHVAPPSNHIDVARVTGIEYTNNNDEVRKKVDTLFDDQKTEAISFDDEFTQFSQDDDELMLTTREAEGSNVIDNDNKQVVVGRKEYDSNNLNNTECCGLDETSCYYNEEDGIADECLSRGNSCVYESLAKIRNDEISEEITEEVENEGHVDIEQTMKEDFCGNSNDPMDERVIEAETELLTSCVESSSRPHLLTVAKTTSGAQLGQEEEEDLQQEVDDQEWEEEANENKNMIYRNDEIQMFASLKAAQFVDGVLNIGIKRARIYILEKNSRCIGKMRRSQKQIRAQFLQNRRSPHRKAATAYFTEESDSESEEEDEATTSPPQPLREEHQTQICELTRLTKNKDLAADLGQRVRNLNLNSTDVLDMSALISVMKASSSSITSLSLVNSSLGDDAVKVLSKALPNLTSLRKLYLGNNEILCPGARNISIAVSTLPTLEVLSLSHNPIGPKGIRSLATLVAQSTCQLKTLKIGGCISLPTCTRWKTIPDTISQDIRYPGDEGAICLAAALLTPHACPLESLSYINAGFSGVGARAFAAALFCTPPSLTNLNLSGSVFAEKDPTAADVLEAAVSVAAHRLKQITLTSCGLSQDAAERIYSLVDNPAASFPPRSLTWIEERELGGQATALRSWLLDAASKISFSYPREEQRFPRKREKHTRDASLQNLTHVAEDDIVRPPQESLSTKIEDESKVANHYKVSARESRIIIEQEANDSCDKVKREEKALSDFQKILRDTLTSFSSFEMQEFLEASCFASLREKVKALFGRQNWKETFQCSRNAPERTVVPETSSSTKVVEKFRNVIKIDQVIARLEKSMKDVESQSEIVKQSALVYKEVMTRMENQNLEQSRMTLLELARPLHSAISLGGLVAALSQDPKSTVDELNMTIEQRQQLYRDRKQAMEQEKQQKRACESRRIKKQVLENKRKKHAKNKSKRGAALQIKT